VHTTTTSTSAHHDNEYESRHARPQMTHLQMIRVLHSATKLSIQRHTEPSWICSLPDDDDKGFMLSVLGYLIKSSISDLSIDTRVADDVLYDFLMELHKTNLTCLFVHAMSNKIMKTLCSIVPVCLKLNVVTYTRCNCDWSVCERLNRSHDKLIRLFQISESQLVKIIVYMLSRTRGCLGQRNFTVELPIHLIREIYERLLPLDNPFEIHS